MSADYLEGMAIRGHPVLLTRRTRPQIISNKISLRWCGMSNDPDFERRIDNQLATIAENQARFDEKMAVMQEAIAGLIQVARIHDEQIDRNSQQIKENSEAIKELREGLRDQRENINALIRVVEDHVTNHP
ncbi:MAG: hypothetical protein ACJ74G_24175 [Blastocatellia bacterium]